MKIIYQGISNLENIKEIYQLEINDKIENAVYTYNMESENVFSDNLQINDFNKDDTMFLDNKTNSEVQDFLKKVENRLISVNNEQMEKLNLKGKDNTLKYIIPNKILNFLLGKEIYADENDNKQNEENSQNIENQENTENTEILGEDILKFNKKFENYQGTKQLGTTIKGLFTTIEVNNDDSEKIGEILEINLDGQEYGTTKENMDNLKNNIVLDSNYKVEFEKNENGIIFRVIIIKE